MKELIAIELRIARNDAFSDRASIAAGLALAALYLCWRWDTGALAFYTWIVPALLGGAVSKLWFARRAAELEQERRRLLDPGARAELPEARALRVPVLPTNIPEG